MSKIQEGEQHLLEAQRHLKTGLLKWKPDYDSAASELEKAATCFKQGKAIERANTCFMKAAETYLNCKQAFAAAKCYEQSSIILYKEMDNVEDAVKLIEKACRLYREHGVPDTAAITYDRTAKMIESKHPEDAAKFYILAWDTAAIEDRPQTAVEYACKGAKLLVRLKKYQEAVDVLRKCVTLSIDTGDSAGCGKLIVFILLLQLAMEDLISANRTYHDAKGLLHPEERATLSQLIEGYDSMDARKIVAAYDNPFIRNLDNEYSKLARSLQELQKEKIKVLEDSSLTEEERNREMEEGILL